MTVWISELSLTEQVLRPGVREIVSTNNPGTKELLEQLGVPLIPLTAAFSGRPVPALIGMRLRVQSIARDGSDNVMRVRWGVTFSPVHDAMIRRIFSHGEKVRFNIKSRLELVVQKLTKILCPLYAGGVIDVFYFLTPEHLSVLWFVPDAYEGLRYEERLAQVHNKHVHAAYYFFLPETWVNPFVDTFLCRFVCLWGGNPDRIPRLNSVPFVPERDLWQEEETRVSCKALFELKLRPSLDSLWRAVFVEDTSAVRELEKQGYEFAPKDHTVFDASGRLVDIMNKYTRNLANLENLTLFGRE